MHIFGSLEDIMQILNYQKKKGPHLIKQCGNFHIHK